VTGGPWSGPGSIHDWPARPVASAPVGRSKRMFSDADIRVYAAGGLAASISRTRTCNPRS
jgi:hypothetical protein